MIKRTEQTVFGFWLYLMSDCVLFASLFAMYAVLAKATAGGPEGTELFSLPLVLLQTGILLTSSFAVGMTLFAAQSGKRTMALSALAATLLLGASFIGLEVYEFSHLVAEGFPPARSAFLSAFFALVGTHGLHVAAGIVWGTVVMAHIWLRGLSRSESALWCFALFWHFLDIVWIFIFTFVYLFGLVW